MDDEAIGTVKENWSISFSNYSVSNYYNFIERLNRFVVITSFNKF